MKNLTLFSALLTSISLTAQTTKSIEVTVMDTVELKVKSAVLVVSIEDPYRYDWEDRYYEEEFYEEPDYYSEEEFMMEQENSGKKKKDKKSKKGKETVQEEIIIERVIEEPSFYEEPVIDEVRKEDPTKKNFIAFLVANGIAMDSVNVPKDIYDYMEEGQFRLKVEAKSLEQIKQIYAYRDSSEFISVRSEEVQTESLDQFLKPTYERLYAKAKNEAGIIASVTGMKLGAVVKVSIPLSPLDPLVEMQAKALDKISKSGSSNNSFTTEKKVVTRTFVFEAK